MVIFEVESGSGEGKYFDILIIALLVLCESFLGVLFFSGYDLIFLVVFVVILYFIIILLRRGYENYIEGNYHLVFYEEWFSVVRGEFTGDFLYKDVERLEFDRDKTKEGSIGRRVELKIKGRGRLVLGNAFLERDKKQGLRRVLIQNIDRNKVVKK